MQSIGFDVGGTFTDIVAVGNNGRLAVRKILSTPVDYSDAICSGIAEMIKNGQVSTQDARHLVHGATVATNTVITRTGAKVGLITTEGFRDVLEIGRLRYPRLYDMAFEKPLPLVQRLIRNLRDRYGTSKLVWGSDMPNVERFCTYRQSIDYIRNYCEFLSSAEKDRILGGNILDFLGVPKVEESLRTGAVTI